MSAPADQVFSAPTPPSGAPDLSSLEQEKATIQGSVIPGLEREKADYDAQAEQERGIRSRLDEQQRAQLAPLEEQLEKGFQASGIATEPPQYNIGALMKTAPLFMMMAGMAGTRGRLVGTAGINALNGMVKGLIQGDVQQYETHRKEYEDRMKEWHEYSAHIRAIVSELQKSYGTDVTGTLRAEQAAIRASGNVDVRLKDAHSQVIAIDRTEDQLRQLEEKNKRTYEVAKLRAGSDRIRANIAGGKATSEDLKALNSRIRENQTQQARLTAYIASVPPSQAGDAKRQLDELQTLEKQNRSDLAALEKQLKDKEGAGPARPGQAKSPYKTAEEVRDAVRANKITKDQGTAILKEQFGYT